MEGTYPANRQETKRTKSGTFFSQINLIGKAKAALQATTESVNALALVQLKAALKTQTSATARALQSLLARQIPDQEQPVAHNTDHSEILDLLTKLENDLADHLDTTRGEWDLEKSRLSNLKNESETKIKNWQTKIADDTRVMEDDHAAVLRLDQELNQVGRTPGSSQGGRGPRPCGSPSVWIRIRY